MTPASLACSFPLQLSPSGEPDGPETSLRVSPDCVRDSAPRSAAHTFTAPGFPGFGIPRPALPLGPYLVFRSSGIATTSCCTGLMVLRVALPLPPFALWPAFPTSDYYGGSDAAEVSPVDRWPPFHSSLPRSCSRTLRGRLGGGF